MEEPLADARLEEDSVVEARTRIKFRPWLSPNYVCLALDKRDSGTQSIPVAELDEAALLALARAWLGDLYSKTTIPNPFKATNGSGS